MGATLFGATPPRQAETTQRRRDNLALAYQNLFTVIARIRSGRQTIADPHAFRQQIQGAIRQAEKESVSKLYPQDDVRLATFALVALLDESILNSNLPTFADWARMPLQEEMFGNARAGEVFFQHLESLLARSDSNGVADLLEVYALCLLLGFKGKYGLAGGSVRPVIDTLLDKIRRIRGPLHGFSPAWAVPEGTLPAPKTDSSLRMLGFAALWLAGLTIALFVLFRLILANGVSSLNSLATHLLSVRF